MAKGIQQLLRGGENNNTLKSEEQTKKTNYDWGLAKSD